MFKLLLVLFVAGASNSLPFFDDITPRAGQSCGYESCPKTEPGVLNVHIVPHTHDDVGWLKTVDQYYYGSRNNIQKAGVQYIIDSVVKELWQDPKRRFIYVETAFFWKWWTRQPDSIRHKVHVLVRQGRLQFVGGAWSMNDEAATHYQSTIDQFTWGLSKLNQTFGRCGMPRVGWQIDPFGHAREFASLLAGMGYDGLFLGRIDYQDKNSRLKEKRMEMLWRGDDDLGKSSDIFTGILYNTYSPPPGFCFDVLCSDEPIIDEPDSPLYNVDSRIGNFIRYVQRQAQFYRSNNVIITMGGDFTYQDATMWYTNLDKLIEYTNLKSAKDGLNIKLFYSTPDCYLKAVKDANPTLPTKQDDFFPYASDPTAYWTGYFTSRPTTKYFEREANDYLQAFKQLQVLAGLEKHNLFVLNELKSAMGVMQHHDAVTGTEKQHVTFDYERLLDQAVEDALLIAKQALNKYTQQDGLKPPILSIDRCHFNESRCYTSENNDKFVVTVYNPLGWSLEAVPVRIPVPNGKYAVIAPNGEEIISQLVELPVEVTEIPSRTSIATHEIVFLAYGVPGMGYKAFYVKKEQNKLKRDIKHSNAEKRTHYYYDEINDYWKNVREKTPIDIKNIEEGMLTGSRKLIIHPKRVSVNMPDPEIAHSVESAIDTKHNCDESDERYKDNDRKIDLGLLMDKNDGGNSEDVKQLDILIREARKDIPKTLKRMPKKHDSEKSKYPDLNDEEMRMLSDDPMIVQRYPEDEFEENEPIKLATNPSTGEITHIITRDGLKVAFTIQMLYYPGCYGNNVVYANRSSGAYIFRPNASEPYNLYRNETKLIKGSVVNEVHYTLADYASGVARVYSHPKLNYIENEWLVGPIPIDDNVGKEIIVKYITDIVNNGAFYTDSNGRQALKRKLNQRPQWNLTLDEPIAGNYYPVTNKIFIEGDKRAAVLTDRSQGGSSLAEGNIELMLHRRLLHDDAFGVGEPLNETVKGVGLVARGKHRIVISNSGNKEAIIEENKKVLENHLQPLVFVSNAKNLDLETWLTLKNKYGGIKTSVPNGIHILTLEPWQESTFLLRLENYVEKSASEQSTIEVDLSNIFNNLNLKSFRETTLSANQWLTDYKKWTWNKEEEFVEQFNEAYGSFSARKEAKDETQSPKDNGFKIKLQSKQIRTFVVAYELLEQ